MALVDCRECGKQVSGTANKCPECGVKTPNAETYNSAKKVLKLLCIVPVLLVVAVIFSGNPQDPIDDLARKAASEFVKNNPELGELVFPYIEKAPDWAQGKRLHVTTDLGSFLFYLKEGEVITVYLNNVEGNRLEIWRKP